jgi:uncharacterized protein YfiM (DUF2279 family)
MMAAWHVRPIFIVVGMSFFSQAVLGQTSCGKIETLLARQITQPPGAGQYVFRGAVEDSTESRHGDLSSLISAEEQEEKSPDLWVGKDKCKHFLLCGFWSAFGYLLCHRHFDCSQEKSLLISGGAVFSSGVTKEIRDSFQPDNRFSYKDLVFDVVGVGCGLFIASR